MRYYTYYTIPKTTDKEDSYNSYVVQREENGVITDLFILRGNCTADLVVTELNNAYIEGIKDGSES